MKKNIIIIIGRAGFEDFNLIQTLKKLAIIELKDTFITK